MVSLTFQESPSWDLEPGLSETKDCEHAHCAVLQYPGVSHASAGYQ